MILKNHEYIIFDVIDFIQFTEVVFSEKVRLAASTFENIHLCMYKDDDCCSQELKTVKQYL